jgi:uncharacterized protein YkwD
VRRLAAERRRSGLNPALIRAAFLRPVDSLDAMRISRNRNAWTVARRLALMAALALGACGGGGDSATAAAPSPTPAAPVDAPVPTAGSTCSIPSFSVTLLARLNALRAAGADCGTEGVKPPAAALAWNVFLTQAAEAHTQDMVAKNYFSHTGSDGSTLANRIDLTGYRWSTIGENIAAGYASIDTVLAGLMASDGHCANIMEAGFADVGAVCVPGTSANVYSDYWTMDFGHAP